MFRKPFLRGSEAAGALTGLLVVCSLTAAAESRRPNFVFLLADDLGWADTGCYGSDLHETPHIDRLAGDGVRFTDAYAAAPVCSPTRASILTGKFPARLHMTIWRESAKNRVLHRKLLPPDAVADLPHEEVTIAEALEAAGYTCAHVGKWHLGGFEHYPQTMGFDIAVGGTGWGAPATYWWPYSGAGVFGDEFRYVPHLEWGRPGEYLTDRLTTEAIRILEKLQDRPFFLYMCWHSVHTPIEGKPQLAEKYRGMLEPGMRHQNPGYAAMVESLDQNVGRVLAKLDELDLARSTVVFFTSDNGGFVNNYKGVQVTDNHPLRSGKGSLYEGGVRVPLLVRWPGRIEPGGTRRTPVLSTDFYPTILEMAGLTGESAPDARPDGVSLVPVLRSSKAKLDRDSLYWHYPHYYATTTPASAIREGDWKLVHYFEDDRVELYNLAEDLGESKDLSAERPDRAAALRLKLDKWLRGVDAQLPAVNPAASSRRSRSK